jgi:hypothetical protein
LPLPFFFTSGGSIASFFFPASGGFTTHCFLPNSGEPPACTGLTACDYRPRPARSATPPPPVRLRPAGHPSKPPTTSSSSALAACTPSPSRPAHPCTPSVKFIASLRRLYRGQPQHRRLRLALGLPSPAPLRRAASAPTPARWRSVQRRGGACGKRRGSNKREQAMEEPEEQRPWFDMCEDPGKKKITTFGLVGPIHVACCPDRPRPRSPV